MRRFFLCMLMLLVPWAAWGHGGEDHDHGDGAATALPTEIAPRAVARSDDFELVAVLADGRLTLYLDRNADNAPVAGAALEVESGAFKAVAREVAPAVYVVPGDNFAKPGNYPLMFTIQAGETADLLSATLELAAPEAPVEHVHSRDEWAVWAGAAAVLLAGIGLALLRRHRMKGNP